MSGFIYLLFSSLITINFLCAIEQVSPLEDEIYADIHVLFANEKIETLPEDLYLVLNSTRQDVLNPSSFIHSFYSTDQTDLSYTKSFDGLATTMDQKACVIPDVKHIIGDAKTFNFSKYRVKGLYIEQLLTIYNYDKIDVFKQTLKNIYPHMTCGAKIEVELLPCGGVYSSQAEIDQFFSHDQGSKMKQIQFVLELIQHATNNKLLINFLKNIKKDTPEAFKKSNPVVVSMIKIRKLIKQFKQHGLASAVDYIRVDLKLLPFLLSKGHSIVLNELPENPLCDLVKSTDIYCHSATNENNMYNLEDYLAYSLTGLILTDLVIQEKSKWMQKYLQHMGFKNIKSERKTSPHNFRRNVWIVTATKS